MKTRISKITFKDTGHVLRIYDFQNKAQLDVKDQHQHLDDAVAQLHDAFADDMEGYALVVWGKDGEWLAHMKASALVGGNTLPDFVAGALRREIAVLDTKHALNEPDEEDGPA